MLKSNLSSRPLVVVGYDLKEDLAYKVCKESILATGANVDVIPLSKEILVEAGLFRRPAFIQNGQQYDCQDQKPFSTEFSFTRFLTPLLGRLFGRKRAMFVDSDFLFLKDPTEMIQSCKHPVNVVKMDYRPSGRFKMREKVVQEGYNRKLWSALMVFDAWDTSIRLLTPYEVNFRDGSWLHQFKWIDDRAIGSIDPTWQFVPGFSTGNASAVHYTTGTPDVEGHEQDNFAAIWRQYANDG